MNQETFWCMMRCQQAWNKLKACTSVSWKIQYIILKTVIKLYNSRKWETAIRIDNKTKVKTQMVQKYTDTFSE